MKINTLILGKSGAGKSTLLNYLYGEKIAETGTGKPVTKKSNGKENLLYKHKPFPIGDNELVIYDSWGMEADNANDWVRDIVNESKKREASENNEDWFHAVIYCIGASSARIEPFELEEVISELKNSGQTMIFVLTKADLAKNEEKLGLRKELEKISGHGGVVEIESLSEKKRNGEMTKQHGRDELILALTKELDHKLRAKYAFKYIEKCRELLISWKYDSLRIYENNVGYLRSTVGSIPEAAIKKMIKKLNDYLGELAEWGDGIEGNIKDLQNAFEKTLRKRDRGETPLIAIDLSIDPEELEIETEDRVLNFIAYLVVPGASLILKEQIKSEFEKRLDKVIEKIILEAEKASSLCHFYEGLNLSDNSSPDFFRRTAPPVFKKTGSGKGPGIVWPFPR